MHFFLLTIIYIIQLSWVATSWVRAASVLFVSDLLYLFVFPMDVENLMWIWLYQFPGSLIYFGRFFIVRSFASFSLNIFISQFFYGMQNIAGFG